MDEHLGIPPQQSRAEKRAQVKEALKKEAKEHGTEKKATTQKRQHEGEEHDAKRVKLPDPVPEVDNSTAPSLETLPLPDAPTPALSV